MKALRSSKFHRLSNLAKILLMFSYIEEEQLNEIHSNKRIYGVLGLNQDEDFLLQNLISEIHLSGIDYSLNQLKFKPPTHEDCCDYLRIYCHQKQLSYSLDFQSEFCQLFIDYYAAKAWKISGDQMVNWKNALNRSIIAWKPRESTQAESVIASSMEAFMIFNEI